MDEVDTEGNTPLNIAVHNNDIEIAKALIDRDADNLQNSISDSPIFMRERKDVRRF